MCLQAKSKSVFQEHWKKRKLRNGEYPWTFAQVRAMLWSSGKLRS
jgi:hypothetical protein